MAHQALYEPNKLFDLDLHGVKKEDAKKAILSRLAECYRFGLSTFRCCFGSPDRFRGSIAELLCDLVAVDRHVRTEALPEWVWAPESAAFLPIYLTIPVSQNDRPEPLVTLSRFEGFKADHEADRGQRLLCEMPFQPLRKLYEWSYATRAIKRHCTEPLLRKMCSDLNIVHSEDGITLAALMKAAVAWDKYGKELLQGQKPQITTVVEKEFPPRAASSQIANDVEPGITGVTVSETTNATDVLDELILRGEYLEAMKQLTELQQTSDESPALLMRRGKILLLQGDATCETWLLRAETPLDPHSTSLSVTDRRECLRLLCDWYSHTGEVDMTLRYQQRLRESFSADGKQISPGLSFALAMSHAVLLRQGGHYFESCRTLKEAIWSQGLRRDAATPKNYALQVNDLEGSGIPAVALAKAHILYAQNATDLHDHQLALEMLGIAESLSKKVNSAGELRARVLQQKGILLRKAGDRKQVLDCYKSAFISLAEDPYPDPVLSYELNMSAGVIHAELNHLRRAEHHYHQCDELAKKLNIVGMPEHAKVMISLAGLRFRQRRFEETIELGLRAYDLLLLKAPNRHYQMAAALHWVGKASLGKGDFETAFSELTKAKDHYSLDSGLVPEKLNDELDADIAYALNEGLVDEEANDDESEDDDSEEIRVNIPPSINTREGLTRWLNSLELVDRLRATAQFVDDNGQIKLPSKFR